MDKRKCIICNKVKLLTADYFYKHSRTGSYDCACKICRSARRPGPLTTKWKRSIDYKIRHINKLEKEKVVLVNEIAKWKKKVSRLEQELTQYRRRLASWRELPENSTYRPGSTGAEVLIWNILGGELVAGSMPFDLLVNGQRIEVRSSKICKCKFKRKFNYDWLVFIGYYGSKYQCLFLFSNKDARGLDMYSCGGAGNAIQRYKVTEQQLVERVHHSTMI